MAGRPLNRDAPALVLGLGLLALAWNAVSVSARLPFLHKPHQVLEHDHLRYLEMAKGSEGDPELARQSPYCFRVLVPALAGALWRAGLKLNLAFWLLTNLALLGLLLALERWLSVLGFALRERLLGIALVGLVQGLVRWFEYQYWMTDPQGLLLLVLALVLLHRGRLLGLGCVNALAALVRETHVVLVPYVFLHRLRLYGWRDAVRTTLLVSLVPGLIQAWLHHAIVPLSGPSLGAAIVDNLGFRFRHLLDNQLYLMTLGTWGVLLPLALLWPRRTLRHALRRPAGFALLCAVYLSTFLISNNNERPLAYAVPVLLPAALHGLERLRRSSGLPFAALALAVLGLQLAVYQQTLFTGLGISIYQPFNGFVTVLLGSVYLGARALLARRGRARPSA